MSVCVLAALFVGAPLVAYYPRPVIGGLLLSFGVAMIAEYVILSFFRIPLAEWLVVVAITMVIAFVGLMEGMLAGLVMACVQFAVTCGRQQVVKNEFSGASRRSRVQRTIPQQYLLQRHGDRTVVLELQGFLFFGVATELLDRLKAIAEQENRLVVFDFRLVHGLDSSAVN